MSIDMSEFYQVFFEEAAEMLANMENLLLGVDMESPSTEDLNAIFRVAHSIKGGAATFGFTDVTETTHVLESLLDRLRNRELQLRPEMVDAFLVAGDVIKAQLAGHRGEGAADPADAAAVCQTLERLAKGLPAEAQQELEVAAQPPEAANVFRIAFPFSDSEASLEALFANLRQLGTLEVLKQPAPGGGMCELRFSSAASAHELRETLAFVVDPERIELGPWSGAADSAPAADAPEENDDFGFFEPLSAAGNVPDDGEHAFYVSLYEALTGPAQSVPISAPSVPPQAPAAAAAMPVKPAQPLVAAPQAADEAPSGEPKFGRRRDDAPGGRREGDNQGRRESDKADASSIRVNTEKVDQLINLVGELVITQAMLAQAASKVDPVTCEALLQGIAQLERNTRDLQESVMSIRMLPIGFVFSRFPRVVRDLAAKLNKQIELKTYGEATELDKGLIEKISDPLTHLVRNSLDHGIESPEKRIADGKPAKGTVSLRAFHQGGNVVIEVSDDGGGLNRQKILSKARERGLPVHDGMSDGEVWQLIFEAGFSTADAVTDVSGRGVGMDVVKRNIQALGGSIEISSVAGAGTTMTIRLPLTLAILDGMSVSVGGELFIVPLTYIIESLQPAPGQVKTVGGGRVLKVRGEYLPLVALHEVFSIQTEVRDVTDGIVVILDADNRKTAMFVDALIGQHQVVIKSLESNYRRVPGISGATIMGDGKVALILDAAAIACQAQPALAEAA